MGISHTLCSVGVVMRVVGSSSSSRAFGLKLKCTGLAMSNDVGLNFDLMSRAVVLEIFGSVSRAVGVSCFVGSFVLFRAVREFFGHLGVLVFRGVPG